MLNSAEHEINPAHKSAYLAEYMADFDDLNIEISLVLAILILMSNLSFTLS